MPWHDSKDPYEWLLAETLLRRTTRTAARRVFEEMVKRYPTWSALASATQKEIAELVAPIGLGNQRSQQLKAMANAITEETNIIDLCNKSALLNLQGVGNYTADALLLYVCYKKAFPIDANVQRILRRVIPSPTVHDAMHSNPYHDSWIKKVVGHILTQFTALEMADIHRGVLHIAWEACRPKPRCSLCALRQTCKYALREHCLASTRFQKELDSH